MMGSHLIKSWSTTQPIIALSSGEAELYAIVKGASQTTGLLSMLDDYGLAAAACVRTDSSAALGIVKRTGLGKTRHIQVQYLWIQEKVANKEMEVQKVASDINPADMLTKHLRQELILRHLDTLNCGLDTERAGTALNLQAVHSDSWVQNSEVWRRQHAKPRMCLFTPMKVAGGPLLSSDVPDTRMTFGKYLNGEHFEVIDNWRTAAEPHLRLERPWTGTTVFPEQLS